MEIDFTNETIQAALLTVFATLFSSAIAAIATVYLTKRKEKSNTKKGQHNNIKALKKILEELYIPHFELKKDHLDPLLESLESQQQINITAANLPVLKTNLFEVLQKDHLLSYFNENDIDVTLLYKLIDFIEYHKNENLDVISNSFNEALTSLTDYYEIDKNKIIKANYSHDITQEHLNVLTNEFTDQVEKLRASFKSRTLAYTLQTNKTLETCTELLNFLNQVQ